MKRPLGFVALFYGGGLILAEFFPPPLFFLFPLSLTLAALALILPRTRIVLLWPLIILTAWANLLCRTEIISPHDLRVFLTDPEEVIIRGRLLESPDERV